MKNNYDRSLELLCPTCASVELHQNDLGEDCYVCSDCEGVFSYEQLEEGNSERLSNAVEELKSEILEDMKSDLSKMFKGFGKK